MPSVRDGVRGPKDRTVRKSLNYLNYLPFFGTEGVLFGSLSKLPWHAPESYSYLCTVLMLGAVQAGRGATAIDPGSAGQGRRGRAWVWEEPSLLWHSVESSSRGCRPPRQCRYSGSRHAGGRDPGMKSEYYFLLTPFSIIFGIKIMYIKATGAAHVQRKKQGRERSFLLRAWQEGRDTFKIYNSKSCRTPGILRASWKKKEPPRPLPSTPQPWKEGSPCGRGGGLDEGRDKRTGLDGGRTQSIGLLQICTWKGQGGIPCPPPPLPGP